MQSVTAHKNFGLMAFVIAAAFMLFAGINAHAQWRDRDDDNYRNGQVYGRQNGRYGQYPTELLQKSDRKSESDGQKRRGQPLYRYGRPFAGGLALACRQ